MRGRPDPCAQVSSRIRSQGSGFQSTASARGVLVLSPEKAAVLIRYAPGPEFLCVRSRARRAKTCCRC